MADNLKYVNPNTLNLMCCCTVRTLNNSSQARDFTSNLSNKSQNKVSINLKLILLVRTNDELRKFATGQESHSHEVMTIMIDPRMSALVEARDGRTQKISEIPKFMLRKL